MYTREESDIQIFNPVKDAPQKKQQSPFNAGYVSSVKSKTTVDLKRDKLESVMHDGPLTSADGILISMERYYNEVVDKQMAVEEDREVVTEVGADSEEDSHNNTGPHTGKNESKVPYKNMCEENSMLGWQQLKEKNIIEVRLEKEMISREKCMLQECIVKYLENNVDKKLVSMKELSDYMVLWQPF